MIVDSGDRREFSTGAVRDVNETKGRCDLLPLKQIGEFLDGSERNIEFTEGYIISLINEFIRSGEIGYLKVAIQAFIRYAYSDDKYTAILELSKHYAEGAKKYEERNWEKGIPLHCFIDSSMRHYLKFLRGDNDEAHNRAFLWNIFGALWTIEEIHNGNLPKELEDLPYVHPERKRGKDIMSEDFEAFWREQALEKLNGQG